MKFYAALGNHDDANQVFYEPFNMGGKRFHAFRPKADLRFFALDSNYMSPEQLVEIADEGMHCQAISDEGRTVDSGMIRRPPPPEPRTVSAAP